MCPGQPPARSSWHGTLVAGTIVARSNNVAGIAGTAPGARVQPVRVLGKYGGTTSDLADAITWASGGTVGGIPANATPVKVINLSLGPSAPVRRSRLSSPAPSTRRTPSHSPPRREPAGTHEVCLDNFGSRGVFAQLQQKSTAGWQNMMYVTAGLGSTYDGVAGGYRVLVDAFGGGRFVVGHRVG